MIKLTTFINKKKERAQSLVELAISLVVLLMLLMGAIEFSLALFQYVTIRDAAQEGALFASINPADTDGIEYHVLNAADDVLNQTDVHVDVAGLGDPYPVCEGSTGGVPNYITVNVTYDHIIAYPFVGPIIGSTLTLHASATNTILQPSCAPP